MDAGKIDEIAARFFARAGQPGLAYGVIADGRLVHAGGLGECFPGGPVPGPATVFRIASMTKSFTAAAIMSLRDEGALRLDEPAERYVPELSGVARVAADCPPVTIRNLLTMTAGFPTDDPWGDRQQGLPPAEFGRLLAADAVRYCWAPGTRFEYSNLGYAVLGRAITAVTGARYESVIRDRLLTPLGLDRTGFDAAEFDPAGLARGYRWDETGWLELEPDPSGAFAPMGGIFSSVADLARWSAGFADAFPVRDDPASGGGGVGGPGGLHPLSRASRREMQLPQAAILGGAETPAARLSGPVSVGYGFGLFAEEDAARGLIVQHGGGYPGYGSQMRWHPATGLGTVVLANSTYARAGALAGELLAALLDERPAASRVPGAAGSYLLRGPVPAAWTEPGSAWTEPGSAGTRPGSAATEPGPWPETLLARDAVNGLLQDWDDGVAAGLFAPNVARDRPLDRRQADVARLRERIGAFRPDPARPAECDSPAHCRWWLTGERGTASVQIRLTPLRQLLVQQLILAVPPAPGSALHRATEQLVAALNDGARDWPDGLAAAVSTGYVLRQLRIAAAWAGRCEVSAYLAGDGASSGTVELTGPDGRVALTLETGAPGPALQRADGSLLPPR